MADRIYWQGQFRKSWREVSSHRMCVTTRAVLVLISNNMTSDGKFGFALCNVLPKNRTIFGKFEKSEPGTRRNSSTPNWMSPAANWCLVLRILTHMTWLESLLDLGDLHLNLVPIFVKWDVLHLYCGWCGENESLALLPLSYPRWMRSRCSFKAPNKRYNPNSFPHFWPPAQSCRDEWLYISLRGRAQDSKPWKDSRYGYVVVTHLWELNIEWQSCIGKMPVKG